MCVWPDGQAHKKTKIDNTKQIVLLQEDLATWMKMHTLEQQSIWKSDYSMKDTMNTLPYICITPPTNSSMHTKLSK